MKRFSYADVLKHGLVALLCLLMARALVAETHGGAAPVTCAQCHTEALSQPSTFMANALETVEKSKVLAEHPVLTTTLGKYRYRIERKGSESEYSVTDGTKTTTLPIRWAMGASSALGQTYILEKDGELYESRVSWFRELNGLGPTLGTEGSTVSNVEEAAGRLIHRDEKLLCFGCHATNAVHGKQLALDTLTPGVGCERCHESTDAHLAAMLRGGKEPIVPPGLSKLIGMSAEETSNFCGQCHRTWQEIALAGNPGIGNVRFQPYRLTGSKCYDPDDARISCLACHNPHEDVAPERVNFDSKCLACHGGGKPGAKACSVAKTKCVSCHMPKTELPGAHYKFSDHRIRIVRANEPYPG